MIRIRELRLPLDHPPQALANSVANRLEIPAAAIGRLTVFKRSHDIRKKNAPAFIYSVDVDVDNEDGLLARFSGDAHISPAPDLSYRFVAHAARPPEKRPVVVGFGPAADTAHDQLDRHFCRARVGADGLLPTGTGTRQSGP